MQKFKMEIDEIIIKWFDETFAQIKKMIKKPKPLDDLLIGVLHCARKYCNGILVLLGNEHKMPAAALLRILCELYVKMRWCFNAPDKTDEPKKDNLYQRLRRWDYKRISEHKKMLENIRKVSSGDYKKDIDDALKKAEEQIKTYSTKGLELMPRPAEIFNELPEEWTSEIYPRVYQYFSKAVHLDMGLIREMVQHKGGQIQCFSDPTSYKINELLSYCISMGCDINRLIRHHYGCDSDEMQHEYDTIVNQLDKTKKDDL